MYPDNYRHPDDDPNFYDPGYAYELETYDLPLCCPYRQMVPPPGFPQGPQGPQSGPTAPPPGFTPQEPQAQQFGAQTFSVDPGAIKPCLFRNIYIWPRRGNGFWAWLTFVGRRSVSGFRWQGNRWVYFGMDLRDIRSFQCF